LKTGLFQKSKIGPFWAAELMEKEVQLRKIDFQIMFCGSERKMQGVWYLVCGLNVLGAILKLQRPWSAS